MHPDFWANMAFNLWAMFMAGVGGATRNTALDALTTALTVIIS